MTVSVDEEVCIGCSFCTLFCPEHALEVSRFFVAEVASDMCTDCLKCLNCCPNNAIRKG
jgi:pyruvate ferredoxin oxidoreductase delta subunit